ncbi:hypothetical protein BGZ79_011063 [Entomortierella chlamydospora]|nr:hypothetical protein BGZ79_011063 [Entomortierella chlamydospora]
MGNRNSRYATTKAVLIVSMSFMMLVILHTNYNTDFTHYTDSNIETTPLHGNDQPPVSKPETTTTNTSTTTSATPTPTSTPTSAPVSPPKIPTSPKEPIKTNKPSDSSDPLNIIYDSELSTVIQYDNGTQSRIFKPAFFKNPKAAKKELGSFMETLATKSWLVQELLAELDNEENNNQEGGDDDDEEEEEEEEDDDHDRKVSLNAVASSGRYFAYLPMGGGNNQFTSLEKAAILAKDLNRTLLLPPISPNSHIRVWAGPRYSEFYDLDTFVAKSGIPVVEWHDVKQAPESVPEGFSHHWEEFSEALPCIPNGGIGSGKSKLYDKFRQQFLLKFEPVIIPADRTKGKATDFRFARDILLKDTPTTTPTTQGEVDPNMWKCLTCPYFLGGDELNGRVWSEVGVHLRFNDKTEAMADDILDILLGPIDDDANNKKKPFRPHPEFIIVHLRRGDITTKCPVGVDEKDCIVQIEAIADKVDAIEKERRIAALKEHKKEKNGDESEFVHKRLPVLVATNEKREEELEKIETLGWILLDHGDEERDGKGNIIPSKTKKLGTESKLGPWVPPMLDAVLLTRGNYLIGMANSRMSILGTQRGKAWHGHHTVLM